MSEPPHIENPGEGPERDGAFDAIARRLREANAGIAPPADLVDRIEQRLVAARRPVRWRWIGPLAAAAVLALAAIIWLVAPALRRPTQTVVSRPPQPAQEPAPPAPAACARVTFADDSPLFARPAACEHPDITIVFVYRSQGS